MMTGLFSFGLCPDQGRSLGGCNTVTAMRRSCTILSRAAEETGDREMQSNANVSWKPFSKPIYNRIPGCCSHVGTEEPKATTRIADE